jgi:WhiB family transcriptional regulator, redox-sensing transcriptional regulator
MTARNGRVIGQSAPGIAVRSGDPRTLLAVLAGRETWPGIEAVSWHRDALCGEVGTGMFYPRKEESGPQKAVKAVCSRCPVRRECLTYALSSMSEYGAGRYGIWAATSRDERFALVKRFGGDVAAAVAHVMKDNPEEAAA